MNIIPAREIKRRGISSLDELLKDGPVHVTKNNQPTYVVMSEEDYARLIERRRLLGLLDQPARDSIEEGYRRASVRRTGAGANRGDFVLAACAVICWTEASDPLRPRLKAHLHLCENMRPSMTCPSTVRCKAAVFGRGNDEVSITEPLWHRFARVPRTCDGLPWGILDPHPLSPGVR